MHPFHAGRTLVFAAPAKLNLFLNVLGKRSDGYHELETLMVRISLADTLIFAPLADRPDTTELVWRDVTAAEARSSPTDGHATRPTHIIPAASDNLVVRAAELLRRETNSRHGVRIELRKRIPTEAGLAGGSTDAATTLTALNRIWNCGLDGQQLRGLAARLGSDIPFFLADQPAAMCTGRGEIVEPVRIPLGLPVVLVKPASGLSTPRVFQQPRTARCNGTAQDVVSALRLGRLDRLRTCLHNALQEPAEALNEDVRRLRRLFDGTRCVAHQMSGSGTSYFGICRTLAEARHLAASLRPLGVGQVYVTTTCA